MNDTKTVWVLKCDIKKFFANIDQTILLEILAGYIPDRDIVWLISIIVGSFHSSAPGVGLPLGNFTSQLLVNIYMNEFDQFMKHKMKAVHYIRYADDFAVLSRDRAYLERILPLMQEFLWDRLRLTMHPNKISIETLASGVDFLGWVHFPHHRVLRTATKRRMFANPGIYAADEAVVNSYKGLLSHGNGWNLTKHILERSQQSDLV